MHRMPRQIAEQLVKFASGETVIVKPVANINESVDTLATTVRTDASALLMTLACGLPL